MRMKFLPPLLLSIFAAVIAAGAATPSAAREYPICLNHVQGRMGAVERCDFTTVEQCRLAGLGLQGSCAPNWRYVHPEPARRRKPIER